MRLNNPKSQGRFLKKNTPKKKDQDDLWPTVKQNYEDGLEARKPFEQRWIINLAFLAGRQYTFFNSSAHILQQIRKVRNRRRYVDNQLLPHWRRQVADSVKNNPEMSVVPNTTDDDDVKAARIGDKAIKSVWASNRMTRKFREMNGWRFATGNAFMDDRWNPKLGPTSVDSKGNLIYLGDVDFGVWSPFEVVVPAYGMGDTDLDAFAWLDKVKWRTLDYIASNYKRGKEVVEEDHPTNLIDMGIIMGRVQGNTSSKLPGALLHNMYIQPCHDFPKGIFIVAANGVVLETQDYPFNFYHIEQFKDIDVPGVFWGKATLEDGIAIQNRWNRTINNIEEFNRTMAKGKYLMPKGSKIERRIDDTHGEEIWYKPVMGHKPEQMDIKSLPRTYELSLQTGQQSFNKLFSHHEVTQGTNRSDLRSGEMVELLREQDAHGMIPSHSQMEESLEALMSRGLKRIQKGYTNERVIKVVGQDGEFEVLAFKGADLRNNTDVKVKRQSSLPDSRVARESQILRRYEVGLYGNPQDPEVRRKVMNMLDDAVVKDSYADERLDERYARRENEILFQGQVDGVLINEYDNHQIHFKEHNRFRKAMEYQKIKFEDPERFIILETIFRQHVMAHQNFLVEQMKAMMARASILGGKGNGGREQKSGRGMEQGNRRLAEG